MKNILLIIVSLFCITHVALAEQKQEGTKNSAISQQQELEKRLEIDTITDLSKLLVLDTNEKESRLYVFKRFKDRWILLKDEVAEVGKSGVGDNKLEGNNVTPRGMYGFKIAFGHKEDPGSLLKYYQLKPGDIWITDPQSKFYNLFVRKNSVSRDWASAVDLYKATISYAYALVLDYNLEPRELYKGSAMFIQCSIGQGTNGSIAVSRSFMKDLLLFVDNDTKILIR